MQNWKEEFDKQFPTNNYPHYAHDQKVKAFFRNLLTSRLTEIEGKVKRLTWDDFKCDCNMCYVHEEAINEVLEIIKEAREK